MRRLFVMMVMAAALCSCGKENLDAVQQEMQESVLYVNLNSEDGSRVQGGTKATGSGLGIQSDDNHIQTLEIFVFRVNAGAPDDGALDGYRKFTAAELGNLTNLEVQTTTGNKIIYAVANSHRSNWKGVNTRAAFEQQTALLADENLKSFIMVGSAEAQLQVASTVAFTIKRLVARVKVNCIKTAFAGGPYEDMELKDVKAYLLYAQAEKLIFNGLGDNLKIYNEGEAKSEDSGTCAMAGMIYDDLGTNISDAGYETSHWFYCFENGFTDENDTDKFTRVVIEGELNGTVYYYPIVLDEVKRNCSYSIDVTIKRPGSTDPNLDVEKGTLLVTVSVKDWEPVSDSVVEF